MSIPAHDSTSAALSLRRRVATYDSRPVTGDDFVGRGAMDWRHGDVDALLEGTHIVMRRAPRPRPPSRPDRPRSGCVRTLSALAAVALVAQVPTHALASPPTEVQRPQATPSASSGPAPAPAPDAESAGGATPPVASTSAAEVAPPASPHAPPPLTLAPSGVARDQLSLTGTSLWAGLVGRRVLLGTDDGGLVDGRLLSQSHDRLAIALRDDGQVVSVEKRRITGVNVPASLEIPPSDGSGLLAGGGVLLGLGVPVTIAGLVLGFFSPFFGLMFLPGPVAVGAGIPMVVVGSRRRADYRRAMIKATPSLSLNRHGASGGLTLRF